MSESCTPYFVYILRCADNTLYTGITTHLARRLAEHNGDIPGGAKYTRARQPVEMVYNASFENRSDACREEYRIKKKLSREDKEDLITSG